MDIIGIDPGPTHSGVVVYDPSARVVRWAHSSVANSELRAALREWLADSVVLLERTSPGRMASGDLVRTSEQVGRIAEGLAGWTGVVLVPRSWVLTCLHVAGGRGSRDAKVRARCIELHGGTARAAIGAKANPGPLYGVTGHAWQALGLVLAHIDAPSEMRARAEAWACLD